MSIIYNNILLVDDDPDDQEVFADALMEVDSTAVRLTAHDGDNAQKVLAGITKKPDIIFLDINMPKVNGTELLIKLKSNPETAHIPVIMYSTAFSEKALHEMELVGAASFITKQTSYAKLVELLRLTLATKW